MQKNQKNILLVFCDQLRYDTLACNGNSLIKTPALDKLAENSVVFDNAYTPSPVCVAARHCLHSGIPTFESKCTENQLMPYYPSFMEILNENGYQTHGIGKMHFTFNSETKWGFETLKLSEEGAGARGDSFRAWLDSNGYDYVKDMHGVRSEMYYIPQVSQLPERLHCDTWVAQQSVNFLKNRDNSRPFMLMSSFIKPHPPFENPVPWNKLYRCTDMPDAFVPQNYNDLICYVNKYQNAYKYRSQGTDRNLLRTMRAAYYGCVSFVDHSLSLLFDFMKNNNLMENTLVIFTADHGEMLGDYNCYGKRCFLEPSSHIPMIVYDPSGNKNGCRIDTPVSLYDVFPTIMEYAGIDYPKTMAGTNMLNLNKNEARTVYGQFSDGNYALYMARDNNYKYIYSAADDREWLFSTQENNEIASFNKKSETKDISQQNQSITADMRSRLISYFKSRGVNDMFEGDNFKKYPVLDIDPYDDSLLLRQDPPASLPKNI